LKTGLAGAIALLASTFGVSAHAFDYKGTELSFAANRHDDGSDYPLNENRTLQFSGFSQFGLTDQFQVALSYGAATEKYEDEFFADNFMFGGHFFFEDESSKFGGFYHVVHSPSDPRLEMYGLEGSKDFGLIDIEGFIAKTTLASQEFDSYGFAVGVDLNENTNLYLRSQHRHAGTNADLGLKAVGISYDLNTGPSGLPVTLSAEASQYVRPNAFTTWRQYSLMATIQFGRLKSSRFRQQYSLEGYYDSGSGPVGGGPV